MNRLFHSISKKQSFEAEDGHNDDLVMCLVLFSWATRQQYFKNLTDMDVRLAMYQQEIDKIEDDMLPFGYYQSGFEEDDENSEDVIWQSKHEKWFITDKKDIKMAWDNFKTNGRVM